MLQGDRLDQIRDLAWRELELAEDEEVLSQQAGDAPRPVQMVRERRLNGRPLRAITAEHEIPPS